MIARGLGAGACFLLFLTSLTAQVSQGIAPRSDPSDYPARIERPIGIGAAVLSGDEVRKAFAPDLSRDYLVVEVGVFPCKAELPNMNRGNFTIHTPGGKAPLRTLEPETIAAQLQRAAEHEHNVNLHPVAAVGIETGRGYDPATGQVRRGTGVWTSAGVGVGIGGAGNGQGGLTDRDRQVIERELSDKSLPEGKVSKAICGYLYFPAPDKKSRRDLQLMLLLNGERFVLKLR